MQFGIFLKSGVEVLHLGYQNTEANPWPIEHWKNNPGRWRLYIPAIREYISSMLADKKFGSSVESFLLILEIADFAKWGGPPAFTNSDGRVSYSPQNKSISSVGKIDWVEVQHLSPRQQLEAFRHATLNAISRISVQKRKPRDFDVDLFKGEISRILLDSKVSQFSRNSFLKK